MLTFKVELPDGSDELDALLERFSEDENFDEDLIDEICAKMASEFLRESFVQLLKGEPEPEDANYPRI